MRYLTISIWEKMGSSARVLNLPVGVTRGCHVPVTRVNRCP